MPPRPVRFRRVSNPPIISGLKPYGNKALEEKGESVFLHFEEYEAIRLCDHELLGHFEASVIMGVSRPTFTRIYARARQKMADALVCGKQLIIEGGKVYFDSDWYSCSDCGCYFNHHDKTIPAGPCPICKSNRIANCQVGPEENISFPETAETCMCGQCGYTRQHRKGRPCKSERCPRCNAPLIRSGNQPIHSPNLK